MTISIDNQNLDQLAQLGAFFDAVKNPDKYQKLIDSANAAIAAQAALIAPYTTVQLANDYLAKAKAQTDEANADIKLGYDELDAKEKAFDEAKITQDQKIADAQARIDARSTVLDAQKVQQDKDQNILADRSVRLDTQANMLAEKETSLNVREQDLQTKAEKLKALLG